MEPGNRKNGRKLWLGILVSVLCLVVIFYFINIREVIEIIKTARYDYLALCASGVLLFMVIRAFRWRFMLNHDISYPEVFHIQNIGYMVNNFLPLRMGDVARAVLVGNTPPVTIARGISTMVVERMLDMMFIVTLLPFTLAEVERLPLWMRSTARVSGIITLAGIAVLIVAANRRQLANRIAELVMNRIPFLDSATWVRRVDDLLAGLSSLTQFKSGAILILYSILIWLPIIYAYYAALLAVHIGPTVSMAAFVVCAAAFSVAAPSSPGQIGVFHAGVIGALSVLGQPAIESASFAILYHVLNIAVTTVMGIVGLLSTGSTIGQVIETARNFMQRQEG